VVNRVGLEDTQISLNKALETIGREIAWQVPNDFATMVEARNNGVPLMMQAPRAKLTRALELVAEHLSPADAPKVEPEEKKIRKGLFGFLGSGAK
jgi:pilus assembly protein CpaE